MRTARQNLPQALSTSEKFSILLVSPHAEDEAVLRSMLPSANSAFFCSNGMEQAMPQICDIQPAVVICERDLPDGSWKAILGTCEGLAQPPIVLVISRNADENLWAEVLNLGGYDVIMKPFDRMEVTRVLGSSLRHWASSKERQQVSSAQASTSLTAQFA